ncbi:MAG TPA: pilus assembly protein CpaE [Erythrobacter sp.]|jgi:pilus assembly protein CpaE|uniref:Type II/IV secretion system ATPase TadZ/CpaE, associated with Flp pilus assembly n=2 Tax=Erythrobacteraceae TaxID=335929 RepID=A0A0L1KBS3_9SPHN|nr:MULTISPECIES: pilus assembly protein CpaE [Erythrobacteraceae]MAG05701.1 pilus assembly protein CpaE [Sphingomonadaceae bacterium]MBN92387.1 pilus assembly protein CpaE [Erythrobacteraceae bacterium]RZP20113.1 MAG: pilus assembly protein CpaE [Erythrobacter sp.]KNH01475.1 Type II/IV secretion system ATPase TadZ/CpaE, associated with Flp pilus assembly [Qipengyuania citrea LAMA 915]KZX92523.1 pilus assembly protein CpaE [Erythrobacter sp. HI0019]|tara:strand:- start:4128 stop:5417 length:1290 start_codon:yes stop_codon:yes gene_type:complete
MSASLKSGLPGNRDAFAAYICDENALDVLRPVVIELGWPPEKCNKGGLRNAIQSLSVSASPNILMVDLSESGDPLNDINALAEVCEPGTVVIAIGQVNDVRLYRDLLASGIHDYLLKPLSANMLRDSLTQAQAVFMAPKAGDDEGVKRHISTAVIGTRGGVGASTLVTSLAWLFSAEKRMPTALLDLDVHFGTGALTLDLEPGRGLTDAIDNPGRIDGLFIERAMIRANENLAILSAEAPINQPLMTDGAAFLQLQEEFKHQFEMTVLDMPRNMLINFPHLLNEVNAIVLAAEMSLASARDTIRILSWLKTNAPHSQVIVVANKVQPGMAEISKTDFEASIERKIDISIPFDQKAATNAAKLGKTFVDANGGSKASAAINQLASLVIGAAEGDLDESDGGGAKKSLLGALDFKQLLAKKKTDPVAEPAQ